MDGYDDPHGREQHVPEGWGVVQVRIAGATARTYAYETDQPLMIGDWVSLPGNIVSEHGGFGIVKSYGRDGYDGLLKKITARIDEPHELTVKMSVVKSRDQAAKLYDEAVATGMSTEDLLMLIEVGNARMKAKGIM